MFGRNLKMVYICTQKQKLKRMTVEQIVLQLIMMTGARKKSRLAELLEVSPSALGNWISRGSIPTSAIQKVLELLPNVNPEWMAGRSDVVLLSKAEATPTPQLQMKGDAVPLDVKNCQFSRVQMLDEMAATCGDVDQPECRETMTEFTLPFPGLRYVITCQGTSMEPVLYSGDMVAVGAPMNMFDRFRKDEMYLVVTRTGMMVKYVEDPGQDCPYLQLTTANKNYHLEDGGRLPKEEVRSIYRVKMTLNWK